MSREKDGNFGCNAVATHVNPLTRRCRRRRRNSEFMNMFRWPCLLSLVLGISVLGAAASAPAQTTRTNKVLIYPNATDTIRDLNARGITTVRDYGSYWLAEATDAQLAALQARLGDRVGKANYLNVIELQTEALDTATTAAVLPTVASGRKLCLVQFAGPILPERRGQGGRRADRQLHSEQRLPRPRGCQRGGEDPRPVGAARPHSMGRRLPGRVQGARDASQPDGFGFGPGGGGQRQSRGAEPGPRVGDQRIEAGRSGTERNFTSPSSAGRRDCQHRRVARCRAGGSSAALRPIG